MFLLINIIAGLTAFLLLYFSIFLLITKRGKRLNKVLLSAFLFSNAAFILNFILNNYSDQFVYSAPYLFKIGESFGFLFGPLLYFYTMSLVYKSFIFKKKHLVHFVLFISAIIVSVFTYHIKGFETQNQILLDKGYYPHWYHIGYNALMNLQILVYMYFCIDILRRYSATLKINYSEIERQNLSWLSITVFAFFLMWMVDLVSFCFSLLDLRLGIIYGYMSLISLSINFVFANYIIYKGLEHPEHHSGVDEIESKKYQKSTLSEEEKDKIEEKITHYLESERAFLNPNLTLSELAHELDFNAKYVSQVINERIGKNFFDLINYYRIEYAKSLIKENSQDSTILEVLDSSGFNSKSAFNSVFKKITGMTPTEYRKSA